MLSPLRKAVIAASVLAVIGTIIYDKFLRQKTDEEICARFLPDKQMYTYCFFDQELARQTEDEIRFAKLYRKTVIGIKE